MPAYCPPNKYANAVELMELDPTAGIETMTKLARKYPKDPYVHHALGVTYLESGDYDKALPRLEKASRLDKEGDEDFQGSLLFAYATLGMPRHAHKLLKRHPFLLDHAPALDDDVEELSGSVPEGAKEQDLMAFERARYEILHGDTRQGIKQMKAFLKRFASFQPAWNNLVTGYYLQGELAEYVKTAESVLAQAPDNIHALLNIVRAKLIQEGPAALTPYVERAVTAPLSTEAGIVDGELAQAQIFWLAQDETRLRDAVESAKKAYQDVEEPPTLTYMEEKLDLKAKNEAHPLFSIADIALPFIQRWAEDSKRGAEAFLELRGLLALVSSHLAFEDATFARLFAGLILDTDGVEEVYGSWPEIFRTMVMQGPGLEETRSNLALLLLEKEILPADTALPFEGVEGGIELHTIELHTEMGNIELSKADNKKANNAMKLMRKSKFDAAKKLWQELSASYPDDPSFRYNELLADYHSGNEARQNSALQGLEELCETHPQYLFPRALLVEHALEEGDLAKAKSLSGLPEGLKRAHRDAYSYFMAAQGMVLVAEGEMDKAQKVLQAIEDLVGDESISYLTLEQAIDGQVLELLDALYDEGLDEAINSILQNPSVLKKLGL